MNLTVLPTLTIDAGNLPATAQELRNLLASTGTLFDRGGPVKIVQLGDISLPQALRLSVSRIVMETHRICRPVRARGNDLVEVTLPNGVARMYLEMAGDWQLPT